MLKQLIGTARTWVWKRRTVILWPIILVVAGTVAVYLSMQSLRGQTTYSSEPMPVALVALGFLVLALAGHIVHCFTRNLPSMEKEVSHKLRSIFLYAYIFQGLMIVMPLLLFVVPKPTSSSKYLAGFVYGCVLDQEKYGSGLTRCNNGSADGQWLLHIGSWPVSENQTDALKESGGRAELSRGLVVPLYVVVLAIIGGSVGMNRRLPELQRRAAYTYHKKRRKEKDPDPISPVEARERIVFQVMQLLTAPLIAIVAFSALEPDTVTLAVLIGFASGFSSEPLLMKIRTASEAVAGIPASKAK